MVAWGLIFSGLFLIDVKSVDGFEKGHIEQIREFSKADDKEQVLKLLEKLKKNKGEKASIYFGLGIYNFKLGKNKEAEVAFEQALQEKTSLSDYVHFYLGKIYRQRGEKKSAAVVFKRVTNVRPLSPLYYDARFELGTLAIEEGRFRRARYHMRYLERQRRDHSSYPEILWHLVGIEKRRWRICKWVRKLYYRYPTYERVKDWGIDLQAVRFKNKRLKCVPSHDNQVQRIRRLQWAGESDRARAEIQELYKRATRSTRYHVDQIYAKFLISEGDVASAFRILSPYSRTKRKDFDYLMLLGKAGARAHKYQAAVGAYYRAYKSRPRSHDGREALFQSAFLSYQFQDYDGAFRRFTDFVQRFKRSGLSRDARWYLAWIRYLKADYKGAYRDLQKLSKMRHPRRYQSHHYYEKLQYWMAMSLLKQGEMVKSKKIFTKLASNILGGFYTHAARARLVQMGDDEHIQYFVSSDQEKALKVKPWSPQSLENVFELETHLESVRYLANVSKEEMESEESLFSNKELFGELSLDNHLDSQKNVLKLSNLSQKSFKNSKLDLNFSRANTLWKLGLKTWAKNELYEIEKRTNKKDNLRLLMVQYEINRDYHRSSFIGENMFAQNRKDQGALDGRVYWEFAYPRAYSPVVMEYSKKFTVPMELIWGVMRAESRYRIDARSPVGAMGLMQLMPYTAEKVAVLLNLNYNDLFDPQINIQLGVRYLKRLYNKWQGKIPLVAASYNAGPHRVKRWVKSFGHLEMDEFIEHIPFWETRNYTKKVVANYLVYSQLYSKIKADSLAWLIQPTGIKVSGPVPTKEDWSDL